MENLHIIGSIVSGAFAVLALVGGAIWWFVRRHIGDLRRLNRTLEDRLKLYRRKCDRFEDRLTASREAALELKARVKIQTHRTRDLEKNLDESLSEKEQLRGRVGHLEVERRKANTLLNGVTQAKQDAERKLKEQEASLQRAKKLLADANAKAAELAKEVGRLRESGETDANLVHELQQKIADLAQIEREKIALEERLQASEAALATSKLAAAEQEKRIEELIDQTDDLIERKQELGSKLDQRTRDLEEAHKHVATAQEQLEGVKEAYTKLLNDRSEEPGRIWERPARPQVADFVPLARRSMPIISLINLKGGVGKTTLAVNLAALLGLYGKRVLLIDLDYQRSLTLLCGVDRKKLHEQKRTLQHFLFDHEPDPLRLLHCAEPIAQAEFCALIANTEDKEVRIPTDSLEETEMHLQAEWLMKPHGTDVRFLLRRALHSEAVRAKYDYVLLDCPPRLSTACINALTASDFALIPVQLDNVSTISASNLLRKLKQLRSKNILEHLRVLGIVANAVRFHSGKLVKIMAQAWSDLEAPCREAWPEQVYFFETKIKRSSEFAEAAARTSIAAFSQELKPSFTDLLKEMETRILHESRRAPVVSESVARTAASQPGV